MKVRTHAASTYVTAATLVVALVAGCAQVRRVGKQDEARDENKAEGGRQPSTSAAPPRNEGQPAEHGRPPLPATPSSLVTASAARQLKDELRNRGYLKAPSPGPELDAAASDALRRFQQEEGLAATGFPDRETLRRLSIDEKSAYRSAPEETRPEKGN